MIPVYINNWNILTWVQNMCSFLEKIPNVTIIIIDNNSTYEPLLDWYNQCNYEIIRLQENRGPYHGYNFVLKGDDHLQKYGSEYFAFTDADLDLSFCPSNFVEVLQEGVERYRKKCGLSVEINDVPETSLMYSWISIQKQHWKNKIDNLFYDTDVDTTFALYHKDYRHYTSKGTRTDRPYVCKHIPWYYTSDSKLNKEEIYMYSQNPVRVQHRGVFTQFMTNYVANIRAKEIKM